MFAVGRLSSYISRGVYTVSGPFHPSGGAVDIIVVQQPDGSFKTSPWYVSFGKFQGVLNAKEKAVSISIDGEQAGFNMYLDHKGDAYFLTEKAEAETVVVSAPCHSSSFSSSSSSSSSSGFSSSGDEIDTQKEVKEIKMKNNGKALSRTKQIFFRKRSTNDFLREDSGRTRRNSLERAEIAAELLEVNWSTNLCNNSSMPDLDPKKSKHEEFYRNSNGSMNAGEHGEHNQVSRSLLNLRQLDESSAAVRRSQSWCLNTSSLSMSPDTPNGEEKQNESEQEETTTETSPPEGPRQSDPSSRNRGWRIWPFPLRKSKAAQVLVTGTESSGDDVHGSVKEESKTRTRTPSSQQLASLNLKEGRNAINFAFSTSALGKQQVDARIYLWGWNTRIVISDVDGTITKSDVLGQFMPLVGVDWTQTGVTHLFSAIKENGYHLLFLSARAISQAYHTRRFLFSLKQDGKALPDGPVVISPDGLFPSLIREVIRRAPHEFKIACLEDIKSLYPADSSPFYAGFGNRDTDELSYLKVGIPKGKIFIINPKGQVVVNRRVDTKSYTSLRALVNVMFPPEPSNEQEDFNSWNYWRIPPSDIGLYNLPRDRGRTVQMR